MMHSCFSARIIGTKQEILRRSRLAHRYLANGPVHANALTKDEREKMRQEIETQGFAVTPRPILYHNTIEELKDRYEKLFKGFFDTGVYPDEWHWREGLSLPNVTREICNGYKSDRVVASVVLNHDLAKLAAELRGWSSTRIGQDDVIWKPPAAVPHSLHAPRPRTVVGLHRDSEYISKQFDPYHNNSVTVWMALDDADEENGVVSYLPGSHKKGFGDNAEELSFFSEKEPTKESEIRSVNVPAGHAIFHHQEIEHSSGPNRSTVRHRRALVAHLLDGSVHWKPVTKETKSAMPPWTGSSYIYGRYRRSGTLEVDEDFFPILYGSPESGLSRTPWVDTYIGEHVSYQMP
eukprot:scaffold2168_cov180-Amphora_coffeaeformis.AAC.10